MNKRYWIGIALLLMLQTGLLSASSLPDHSIWHVNVHDSLITGGWAKTPPLIERLVSKNLGPDVEEAVWFDLKPGSVLTKGDLAVMIVKLLDKDREAYQFHIDALSFEDKKYKKLSSVFGYVETVLKYGYMNDNLVMEWSCDGNKFMPSKEVTREQFLVILVQLLNNIYPQALGEQSIIAPSETSAQGEAEIVKRLVSLTDYWPRDINGNFIHGILAEAKALNKKLTQFEDVSVVGRYPGFVIVAKKYLLEQDPKQVAKTRSFMTDEYSITSTGKILPDQPAERFWAAYLFSKCFVGRYMPTNRQCRVIDKNNKTVEIPAYGVFKDKWDLEGTILPWTPQDIEERTINVCRKGSQEIVKLKLLANSYIYTPLAPPHAKRDLGIIYAPDNSIYEEDRDTAGVRGYQRVFFKSDAETIPQEIVLGVKNGSYSYPVKLYREGTKAIKPGTVVASEWRKLFYGPTTKPRSDYEKIDYLQIDIEKEAELHWGLYHGQRVEVEFADYAYRTGKEFFEQKGEENAVLDTETMTKFYQGQPIRAYFIPNRPENSQTPVENYGGFVEIGHLQGYTTWYGCLTNRYPVLIKSWFDLKGKVSGIDVKLSQDKFKLDTDEYLHDADGMGTDVSPVVLVPPYYKRFFSPARETEDKLKKLVFDELDYQRILEQQFYVQMDPQGRVIFIESDIMEEQ